MSWTYQQLDELYHLPLNDLLYQAQATHRQHFKSNEVQLSTLLNIKTGACPEDCGYCTQSGHHATGLQKEKLCSLTEVIKKAQIAKENGATRFCMGAAWRSPPANDLMRVAEMIQEVKKLGMETCVTLGILNQQQAAILKNAGLDYYNHNINTSPEYHPQVATTHTIEDRVETVKNVAEAGIHVCCGGIMGMGESHADRISFILQLTRLAKPPGSIPINRLIPFAGTPLGDSNSNPIENIDFVRIVAVVRIVFPKSYVRLSGGRSSMSEEMQALCFMAGANSIHFGEKLLVSKNNSANEDLKMLSNLGLKPKKPAELCG
jgi:biotin synthase